VGDLDDGGAFVVEPLEQVHDLFALGRVEVAGGLVRQDHLGVGDHRPGDAHQLLLTAGELGGEEVLLAHDLEAVQGVRHHGRPLLARDVLVGQRQLQILVHRQIVQQVIALEDEADVLLVERRPMLGFERVDRLVEEVVLAAPGGVQHAQNGQQGRLAGPGGSHDGDEVALVDLEVDAAEHEGLGDPALEVLLDVAQTDHRWLSPGGGC